MEKSNQSLILGLVIGAAVVLAGGFFFYFGAGCADGDCLGLVRKSKVYPKVNADANMPKTAEVAGEEIDLNEIFDMDSTIVEANDFDSEEDLTAANATIGLHAPNQTQIDNTKYEFYDVEMESEGTGAAEGIKQEGTVWEAGIGSSNPWDVGPGDSAHVKFEDHIVKNNSKRDWNNVTASTAFNVKNLVGDAGYVNVGILVYNIKEDAPDVFIKSEFRNINYNNLRYFLETDPFTMEAGEYYKIYTYVGLTLPQNYPIGVYGWFSEVNYNTP